MKKHTKTIQNSNGYFFLLLTIFVLYGCDEEKKPSGYLAKVEDTYLYREDLPEHFDSLSISQKYLSELLQSWVNTEVLYREAIKEGILEEAEFKNLIETAQREIASSLFLKKIAEEIQISLDEKELENYFKNNSSLFELNSDTYLLNYAIFKSFDKSALFRNLLFESDWNKSTTAFNEDGSLLEYKSNQFFNDNTFFSGNILKVITELQAGEVSPIIQLDSIKFAVVQVVQKYNAGEVPEYSLVKATVRKFFLEEKRKVEIEKFIQQLYTKYDIEIDQ